MALIISFRHTVYMTSTKNTFPRNMLPSRLKTSTSIVQLERTLEGFIRKLLKKHGVRNISIIALNTDITSTDLCISTPKGKGNGRLTMKETPRERLLTGRKVMGLLFK